jgi:hypothetical protein
MIRAGVKILKQPIALPNVSQTGVVVALGGGKGAAGVTIGQLGFGIIKAVSGRGVRWGACRHQDGLGPTPSGPRPSVYATVLQGEK